MAFVYLNLTGRAWSQLRRAWKVPATGSLRKQAYLLGPLRSAAAALQSSMFGGARASTSEAEAIFVLGFWRSGTTLLHELISADPRFCFASNYACFHPHHFMFSEKFVVARAKGEVRRPQDNMITSWQTPQEDEFALLCLGARSPYEGLIAAADFGQALQLADPQDLAAEDARRWEEIFLSFFRGVWLSNRKKPVILKSPPHSYRVRTLRRLLPKARFILLVRNPYEVFESMMKTYRAFTLRYGVVPGLPNRQLRELILEERLRCEAKLQSGLSGLASDRLAVVKFEDLTADPLATIEAIYRQFQLPDFAAVRPLLEQKACAMAKPARAPAQPPEEWRERLKTAWADIFHRYGYDVEA